MIDNEYMFECTFRQVSIYEAEIELALNAENVTTAHRWSERRDIALANMIGWGSK